MKYAHLADLHIGAWRDERMRQYSIDAFVKAIDTCVEKEVDFVLFSGDIFNTALPSVDSLKAAVKKMRELKEKGIPLYVIAGSHDFSPSGKTMIEVLEHAGLLVNVVKGSVDEGKLRLNFTIDEKTGVKITGMLGKKGMLDKAYYEQLDRSHLENESGYKIFMFHTALSELKPEHLQEMEAHPLSLLPKGFNYYAGGHVHHKSMITPDGFGVVTYPGALFPCNFAELEKYSRGGFYIIENEKIDWIPISVVDHKSFQFDCERKNPQQVEEELLSVMGNSEFVNSVVTMRLAGKLVSGRTSDINFKMVFDKAYERGASVVMKNTSALKSEDMEDIKVETKTVEEIEESLIAEHLGKIKNGYTREEESALTKELMQVLFTSRKDGETVYVFDERIRREGLKMLGLDDS